MSRTSTTPTGTPWLTLSETDSPQYGHSPSTFQRASIFTEAVVLPPSEPDAIIDLRHTIRAGIADALGPNRVPEPATGYRPHITITYSNAEATARPIRLALDQADPHLATAQITTASLIRLHRDRRMYEWMTVAAVSLGKQTQHLPA